MTTDKKDRIPNAPVLRFPEFADGWKECELKDIAQISKGSGISKDQLSETGKPCVLYGELYTKYKSEVITEILSKTNLEESHMVYSRENDVIIPSSGETAVDISTARCVPFDNILLGGDLTIIRLKEQDGRFFSYQLNGVRKLDIARIAQGVSVVHLYGDNLKRLKVTFPTIAEQNKISVFLSLVDKRIETQSRVIEDLKQLRLALYQRVFTNLQGDSVSLKSVADVIKGNQINGDELSENGKYYVMNGGVLPSGYYDEFNTPANTISISEGGNSCGYVQFNEEPFWSGGHCYTLQVCKTINVRYLFHYLKYKEQDIMKLRIGSGLPNIQKKDLEHFMVVIPNTNKQQKLTSLFDCIQIKENIEKALLSQWQIQKRYLLQKMFI